MTRGGYLTIIGVLIGVIFYQGYSNDRLVDAYREFSLEGKSEIRSIEDGFVSVSRDMIDIAKVMERVTDSVSRIKGDTILIEKVFSGVKNFTGNIDNKEKDLSYVKDRN